jgi:hypothetical protein
MVNDPSNVELIRWSDAGDSFFGAHHLHFISTKSHNESFVNHPNNSLRSRALRTRVLGRCINHRNFRSFQSCTYANSTCTVPTKFLTYNKESSKATTKRNFGKFLMPIVIVDTLIVMFDLTEEKVATIWGRGFRSSCYWNCCRDYFSWRQWTAAVFKPIPHVRS